MKMCFGYLRVSTKKQDKGVSLEEQKAEIERFADRNNLKIDRWYTEKQSAAKKGRPVFNQMVKQLRSGKADGVVMHKIDRSARNWFDWAIIGELADSGIAVHFAVENLDIQSNAGRLAAVQAAVAANYIRNLREEAKKGQRGRLKQGLFPFSTPIGYCNGGKHTGKPKTPHSEKAPMIKRLFDLYATGQHTYKTLLAEAARMGLTNHNGNPITKHTLENMLSNPFYCGLIKVKTTGDTYPGIHEPIISTQLFAKVQDVRAGKSGKKSTKHNHLFRGLFACQACGRSMIAEKQKAHVYYRCHSSSCSGKCTREDKIQSAVQDALQNLSLSQTDIKAVERQTLRLANRARSQKATNSMNLQLAQIDRKLENLEDAVIDKLIDREVYLRRRDKLQIERKRLSELQERLGCQQEWPQLIQSLLERLKNIAEHYIFALPGEKRELLNIAFSNRLICAGNVVVEPSNWLTTTQKAVKLIVGDPHRVSSRTFDTDFEAEIEKLAEIAASFEVQQVFDKFMDSYERAGKHKPVMQLILRDQTGRIIGNQPHA